MKYPSSGRVLHIPARWIKPDRSRSASLCERFTIDYTFDADWRDAGDLPFCSYCRRAFGWHVEWVQGILAEVSELYSPT